MLIKYITVIFLEQYEKILAVWLVIINFISVIVCTADKSRAKRGKRRVRERTLWALTLLGGGVGSIFNHIGSIYDRLGIDSDHWCVMLRK